MKIKYYREIGVEVFKRLISLFVLICLLTVQLPAIQMPDSDKSKIHGLNGGVFDFHFSIADRENSAEGWLEKAKQGLIIAQSEWENYAFDLYSDKSEFEEAKNILLNWSENQLQERWMQWIVNKFLSDIVSSSAFNVNDFAYNQNIELLYHTDSEGNIIYDESTGDPLIIRPDERDLNSDKEALKSTFDIIRQNSADSVNMQLEGIFPELLTYLENDDDRINFNEIFNNYVYYTRNSILQEMAVINSREEHIFVVHRTGDILSLRQKSDREAASIISRDLIRTTEALCNEGISLLSERIEAAGAGTEDLSLAGEEWLAEYQEQFSRGLKAWQDAEENFFVRRIEWEQDSAKLYKEGEDAWALAFNTLEKERNEWENKSKALFEAGEKLFFDTSEKLNKAITDARIEFEKDALFRVQAGTERATALVNTYLTSGNITAAAKENIAFWGKDIDGTVIPPIQSTGFQSWLTTQTRDVNSTIEDNKLTIRDSEDEDLKAELREENKLLNIKLNALSEIGNWYNLYNKYLTIAVDARNSLVNDFQLVMGSGNLADILNENANSEDFNLDEYQIELIRAKAVANYWNKRLEIAKAVNKYAEELTASRDTNTESLKQWEDAKKEYDDALIIYNDVQERLMLAGSDLENVKAEIQNAGETLNEINNRLGELSKEYSVLVAIKSVEDKNYVLYDIAAKYTELLQLNNLLKQSGDNAVYFNYLERAKELGFAEIAEGGSKKLKELIAGDNGIKLSMNELLNSINSINIPDPQVEFDLNIDSFGISTDSEYYIVINKIIENKDTLIEGIFEDSFEGYNEFLVSAISAARDSQVRKYEERISGLRLLTAVSVKEWYMNELNLDDEADFTILNNNGLKYQLQLNVLKNKEILDECWKEYADRNIPEYIIYILLDSVIAEYEKSENLLNAYNEAGDFSKCVIEEKYDLVIGSFSQLFSGYGIETVEVFPGMKVLAEKLTSQDGDITENTALLITSMDSLIDNLPSWMRSEYSQWRNSFIEYMAAWTIYKGISTTVLKNDTELNYNSAKFQMTMSEDAYNEYKPYTIFFYNELLFLSKIEEHQTFILDNEKNWREYITAAMLDDYNKSQEDDKRIPAGTVGKPVENIEIKAAATIQEGMLADKFEIAEYYTAKLNSSLKNGSMNSPLLETYMQAVEKYLLDTSCEWNNNDLSPVEYLYKEKVNVEISGLTRIFANKDNLESEILRLSKGYQIAKSESNITANMKRLEAEIEAQNTAYRTILTSYETYAKLLADKGKVYDDLYTLTKESYELINETRFEYEKQDAIRRWASTAYLEAAETNIPLDEQYKNPKTELDYCQEKYDRAGIVLAAISDIYNNGEARRPFNNSVYNALYEEYRKSFERMLFTSKMRDELDSAVRDETGRNDELYKSYSGYLNEFGGGFNIQEGYLPPSNKSNYNLIDIITVDSQGRLCFSRSSDFKLNNASQSVTQRLYEYFSPNSRSGAETYKSSGYEMALRELNSYMDETITSYEKYCQWSLARDYIIANLQMKNNGIKILDNYYVLDQRVRTGNLGSMQIAFNGHEKWKVNEKVYSYEDLLGYQAEAYNSLSSAEKKNLEFYTILTLNGYGGLNSKAFSYQSRVVEYEHLQNYASRERDSADANVRRLLPLAILGEAISIVFLLEYRNARDVIGDTRNELDRARGNYVENLYNGFSGLETTVDNVSDSYEEYLNSCERLSLLKGKKNDGNIIQWNDIEKAIRAVGTIGNAEINKLKNYWNEMDTLPESYDVQDALKQLSQWSRSKREDAKRNLEQEWIDEETERKNKQDELRELISEYINDDNNLTDIENSISTVYGDSAPARKNHLENMGYTLISNLNLLMNDPTAYHSDYILLSDELIDIITRAYNGRYSAEYQAREAEWEQQVYDLYQKQRAWKEASGLILSMGRDDFKRSTENMREKYSLWKKQFDESYSQTAEEWEEAYLLGLQDKAEWVAKATEAANNTSTGVILKLLGSDAENGARAFDTRDPRFISTPDGIMQSQETLHELLNSAGIINSGQAFSALNNSADTVSTNILRGMSGSDLWNTGNIQLAAIKLAKETNDELAAREAKIIAANARRIALTAMDELKEAVNKANLNFKGSMDDTFILEGGWNRSGDNYVKEIIENSTVVDPVMKKTVWTEGYKLYEMQPIVLKTDLGEERLAGLEAFAIQALIDAASKEIKEEAEKIFGRADEEAEKKNIDIYNRWTEYKRETYEIVTDEGTQLYYTTITIPHNDLVRTQQVTINPGYFGKHIGYAPIMVDNPNADHTPDTLFYDKGEGELGRLLSSYYYWTVQEAAGIALTSISSWDKPIWDSRDSWFEAPTIRDVVDVGIQAAVVIASAIATPFTGGAAIIGGAAILTAINMSDDATFMVLDGFGGYKEWDEMGFEFGKKTLTTFASQLIGGAFKDVGAAVTKSLGEGGLNTIAQGGLSAVQTTASSLITSPINAITYSHDGGFGFDQNIMSEGFKSGAISAVTGFTGAFTSGMLTQLNMGNFNGGIPEKLLAFSQKNIGDVASLNSLVGGLAGQAVNYAITKDFSLNLLNLSDIVKAKINDNELNIDLLEMHLGDNGFRMNIGTGGLSVSLSDVMNSLGGLGVWSYNGIVDILANQANLESENAMKNLQYLLRMQYGFGDLKQKMNVISMLTGKSVLNFVDGIDTRNGIGENALGLTYSLDGKRYMNLVGDLNDADFADVLQMGILLGHEAYRDGFLTDNNIDETIASAMAHTKMAKNILYDPLYSGLMQSIILNNSSLNSDLAAYLVLGENGFKNYAAQIYDSSADFWKLVQGEDGKYNLMFDGHHSLLDEKGNVIVASPLDKFTDGKITGHNTESRNGYLRSFGMLMGMALDFIQVGGSFDDKFISYDKWCDAGPQDGALRVEIENLLRENGVIDSKGNWNMNAAVAVNPYLMTYKDVVNGGATTSYYFKKNADGSGLELASLTAVNIKDVYDNILETIVFKNDNTNIVMIENMIPESSRLKAATFLFDMSGNVSMFGLGSTMPDPNSFGKIDTDDTRAKQGNTYSALNDGTYAFIWGKHRPPNKEPIDAFNLLSSMPADLFKVVGAPFSDVNNWGNPAYRDNLPSYYYDNNRNIVNSITYAINGHPSNIDPFAPSKAGNIGGSEGCMIWWPKVFQQLTQNFSSSNTHIDSGYFTIKRNIFGDGTNGKNEYYKP